jgi:pimeloyl-ACP methyl ester carboxylesterase
VAFFFLITTEIKNPMRATSFYTIVLLLSLLVSNHAKAFHTNQNEADTVTLILPTKTGYIFGTLAIPKGNKKIPLVIFISGSGPTDRDGNNPLISGKNNCFIQLTEALNKHKIATFRFDKRGIGQSKKAGQVESNMRFDDFIGDVAGWIDLFKKDSRFSKVIVCGHSEGALIGTVAALGKADKFVSIAGTGFSIDQTLKTQLEKQLPDSMRKEVFMDIDSLKAGFMVKKFPLQLMSLLRPSVQPYMISWMKYDPAVELTKLKIPVLILQGDNDIQVSEADAARLHSFKPDAQFLIVKGMNHVMKEVPVTTQALHMKTYGDPTLPVSEKLVRKLIRFVKE